ncbi:MAG: hypothetical protein M1826_007602 [Phylliscum demangeonii]|nr:MAG: hypothetical protein M1826_007602 [Phylliscum demangeonii]
MNAILQVQFQRLDAALGTLVDSIASYTPSIGAATALLEADEELSQGLEQLAVHQDNHAKLTELRATSDALATQITQTLRRLVETRAELLATPATTNFPSSPSATRQVPYEELLTYANKISRFTVPPTVRAPAPAPAPAASASASASPAPVPVPASPYAGTTPSSRIAGIANAEAGPGVGVVALTLEETQALMDPAGSQQLAFVPWPTEDTIRRGALARIQAILDAGQDPAALSEVEVEKEGAAEEAESGVLVATTAAASHDQDRKLDHDHAQDQDQHRLRPGHGHGAAESEPARSTTTKEPGRPPEQEKKAATFGGLDLYDPDED